LLEALDARAEVIPRRRWFSKLKRDRDRGQGARRQALSADRLSRNFGHQIAINVGLDHDAGRTVMVMDADLRDPTEVVLKMIAKWKEGYDVVSAERASRQGESRFKRATANLFYRVTGRLGDVSTPRNAGDFRLADRRALRRPRDGQRRH
jgi:dolichol-phosphate mannosyltransferase